MNGLLDPEISVDEIKEVIASGDRLPGEVHPYYYLFKKKPPVIQFKVEKSIYVPKQSIKGYEFLISGSDPLSFVIPKRFLENKVIIAINPDGADREIINEIKEINKTARGQLKDDLERSTDRELPWEIEDYDINEDKNNDDERKNGVENEYHNQWKNDEQSKIDKRNYYTRDIEEYIGWLKKYDQIIDEYKHKNNVEGLIVRYGALILPENCYVPDNIPTDSTKEYETTVRAYERAYAQAIALIQSAPAINFSLSRVQKDLKKKPCQNIKPRQRKQKPKKPFVAITRSRHKTNI
jgi:hypothetical protein